jgi:hypothetical protein
MIYRVMFYGVFDAFEQEGENGLSDVDFALFNVDFASVDGHEFFVQDLSTESPDDDFQNFNVMLLNILKLTVELTFVNCLKPFNEGLEINCLD